MDSLNLSFSGESYRSDRWSNIDNVWAVTAQYKGFIGL
jgi:hypothetical protein